MSTFPLISPEDAAAAAQENPQVLAMVTAKSIPAQAPTVSKSEAVRKALEAGVESPKEGVEWIAQNFSIEVAPQFFSNVKCKIRNDSEPAAPNRNPTASPLPKTKPEPTPAAAPVPAGDSLSMELAFQVKVMVKRWGADTVLQAVKLFAE